MRRQSIVIAVVFFGFVSAAIAQQDAINNGSPQDISAPALKEPPAGNEMYPVIRETLDILKEIASSIRVYKFVEQNPELIRKVDDVIKKDEEALSKFDNLMQFSDPDQPSVTQPLDFDIYTVAREAVDTLKELLSTAQGCKFAEENRDLIKRAEDILKRNTQAIE